ncbi:conserved hypothetical protein [Trichinella spiralis]|uniref:hypothetical protein n=1 Tax=Trichinella spiralis TaxID=6334 RepID=UPI0001EFE96E|nr:conserved hypothetical protein [Trichinella spiralis]
MISTPMKTILIIDFNYAVVADAHLVLLELLLNWAWWLYAISNALIAQQILFIGQHLETVALPRGRLICTVLSVFNKKMNNGRCVGCKQLEDHCNPHTELTNKCYLITQQRRQYAIKPRLTSSVAIL